MTRTIVVAAVAALGLTAAAWFYRGAAPIASAARAIGLPGENPAPQAGTTLQAAGVHKCLEPHGTAYIDGPCPAGSREVAARGGTLTVTSFPKAAPRPASSVLGGPLVRPIDPDERDRLRDQAIDDAANRR